MHKEVLHMRIRRKRFLPLVLCPCLLALWTANPSQGDYDAAIDSYMYKDPLLPVTPKAYLLPNNLAALWLKALERPEMEMRYQAAQAISVARERGFKGLEGTVESLRTALQRPDEQPLVRLALARALIALDARAAAGDLLAQAQAGNSDLRALVEPALARWDFRPARSMWLDRLRDPDTPVDRIELAIQGLATIREIKATESLRDIVLGKHRGHALAGAPDAASYWPLPPSVRLEAARALATLCPEGLEKDAEQLAADNSAERLLSRLAAAVLLSQHRSQEAIRLLTRLAMEHEPAVANLALTRLIEIDSRLVLPMLVQLLASRDAHLRMLAGKVLFLQPTADHIRLLADRLADADRGVRAQAREWLRELAGKKQWREPVLAEASRMLAGDQWRGLEQAAMLVAFLDHKPSAARLVELLQFRRAEVVIAAAWGLRRLAAPETFPGVLSYVQNQLRAYKERRGTGPPSKEFLPQMMDHVLSQLNQLLGQQKYGPAEPVLRQCVPRWTAGMETRAAAIWGLGILHAGKPDRELVLALEERFNDITTRPPEDARVRRMCAISLGRMLAKAAVGPSDRDDQDRQFMHAHIQLLRKYWSGDQLPLDTIGKASAWAVAQITGQPMPPPKPIEYVERNWFLSPFKER
jgi:HEAT repeat protein